MKSTSFSIERVQRLRRAAEQARALPSKHRELRPERERSDGWIASAYDASDLIKVFDTLWLKTGFSPHAYEYRSGPDGNGIIWAVPIENPLLAPEECPMCRRHVAESSEATRGHPIDASD